MIFFSLYFCLVFQNTGFRVRPTDRGWTLGSATGLGMYILISGPTCKMEMTIRASFFLAQYLADVTHGNYFCYWPPGELSDHGFLYCWTAIYIFACMLMSTSTFFSGGGLVAKSCPTLVIPWTVACQAPLSMGFSRQEYWSGLPFPSPEDLSDPEIKPRSERDSVQFSSVQLLSRVWPFATPWIAARPGLPVHHQLPEFTQTHAHRGSAKNPSS